MRVRHKSVTHPPNLKVLMKKIQRVRLRTDYQSYPIQLVTPSEVASAVRMLMAI